MADLPPDQRSKHDSSRRYQIRTRYIAVAALAIAIGHVVYAFLRDHVFDY
ncbi:MAG: hypothetical protein O3A93_00635 [Chloroflexi bacterium]|nr:hypothetical protein [Chloroflexota bacterium]MDA1269754.1 hypothetical protein [Chloroflexota bacterium]